MKCDMIQKTAGAILYTIAGMLLIIWAFYYRDEGEVVFTCLL